MSYDLRKLRLVVEDTDGTYNENVQIAMRFAMAEDDREIAELMSLLSPYAHFANFWGVVRGPDAANVVLEAESTSLRLTWTTRIVALTANTFERRGFMQVTHHAESMNIPILTAMLSKYRQQKVREVLVVQDGKVTFRDLSLQWALRD